MKILTKSNDFIHTLWTEPIKRKLAQQGPFHQQAFQRNSNLMNILFSFHLYSHKLITTNYYT